MASSEPQPMTGMGNAENTTHSTIEPSKPAKHPRRTPAHQSVSLLHSSSRLPSSIVLPSAKNTTLSQSSRAPNPSSTNPTSSVDSTQPNKLQYSSGESSDAGKWFDNSNNHVGQSDRAFLDNEPPFFLRNSSSSETPPDRQQIPDVASGIASALPYRPGLLHEPTAASSSDDFRSVIDDLTVMNKKLKKKLKKYEKLHDAHLQDEKLFEVRVHGLSADKKKELEQVLKKFVQSCEEPTPLSEATSGWYDRHPTSLKHHDTIASSHTSRFAESGYVSMSASGPNSSLHGQNSSAKSGWDSVPNRDSSKQSKQSYNRQTSDIQSYLKDIPAGLLPRHTSAMSEKAKKKVVVRRLEQIFAGKGPALSGHQQPIQQQEVSQSAALADRKALEASGQRARKEGLREARIMKGSKDEEMDTAPVRPAEPEPVRTISKSAKVSEQDFAGNITPDQRPTRPLDLDPYRAQVPADNIDYIRHLGFSPSDPQSSQSPEEGHGWIYLNILTNMAQLHTINVTTDFVKKAVSDYSSKFELSSDGRKIRWRGGTNMTLNSSDSSSEQHSSASPDGETAGKANGKRCGTDDSRMRKRRAMRLARHEKQKDRNKFAYTPLFFHKEDSEADDSFSGLNSSSLSSPLPARDSSAFASSGMKTQSSKKRGEDGPIIFYNKANFCTDLSGDQQGPVQTGSEPVKYEKTVNRPVGGSPLRNEFECEPETRGLLASTPATGDAMDISEDSSSSDDHLEFSPKFTRFRPGTTNAPEDNIDFEVSGIGGVEPQDNFAIYVVSKQARVETENVHSDPARSRVTVSYPPKLRTILQNVHSSIPPTKTVEVQGQIISTAHKSLPPSELPPASFLPLTSSSSDSDSDLDSDTSEVSSSPSVMSQQHSIARQQLHISSYSDQSSSSEEDNDEDDDSDSGTDGSLDFLAQARQIDPKRIQAREREYDAEMAERLAEEIPAGSSAATAGGGSGFCSPASVAGGDGMDHHRMSRKISAGSGGVGPSRIQSLKRARTSDSMTMQPEKFVKTEQEHQGPKAGR